MHQSMTNTLTMTRLESGLYKSRDGRVVIEKVVSKQTYRPDEICWQITIDGQTKPFCSDTYKDAKIEASRLLHKRDQAS